MFLKIQEKKKKSTPLLECVGSRVSGGVLGTRGVPAGPSSCPCEVCGRREGQ